MIYIHQLPDWPQFSWDHQSLTASLASVRHKQGKLLGQMEAMGFDLQKEANLAVLTSDVVKSSAIEGIHLPPEEVRSSVARRLGLEIAGLPDAGRDVDGLVKMMLDATQHFDAPLNKERLLGWHASLFPTGWGEMGKLTVGDWRPKGGGPMQVVSGAVGREKVHFEAPSASLLEAEMTAFLTWFNSETAIDLVLKAGIAHLWFVTIHPFEDGNGRIGRAITDLMLARSDASKDRFFSMSSQIEAERSAYYRGLQLAQRGDLDITSWLTWFLACLERAIECAEQTLAAVLLKARIWQQLNQNPVNGRQRKIINRLLDGFKGHLTTSKYAKMAKCSTDTALRDIQELVTRKVLVQNPGGGRSTSYRLAEEEYTGNS